MYPSPEAPALGTFVEQQVESIRRLGVETDTMTIEGWRGRARYVSALPELWRRLHRGEYDVLHAHYAFAGLIARAQVRCPTVLTHYGFEVFTTWQAPLCRMSRGWFDEVIVQSDEMRSRLGAPSAHVIPCGVDLERFAPRPREEARRRLGLPMDRRLVLWAGARRPEKRFDVAERTMALLAQRRTDTDLVLLEGRPHDQVPAHLNACDLLLLTSDAEGSPNIVKEALASGLPVVSTPVGDVPDLIGGLDGCAIAGQEPHLLADAIERSLDFSGHFRGPELVKETGINLEAIARRVVGVYQRALAA
ncbi:MAG: glycosyltransferase [Solirubrobacterales bacterium]